MNDSCKAWQPWEDPSISYSLDGASLVYLEHQHPRAPCAATFSPRSPDVRHSMLKWCQGPPSTVMGGWIRRLLWKIQRVMANLRYPSTNRWFVNFPIDGKSVRYPKSGFPQWILLIISLWDVPVPRLPEGSHHQHDNDPWSSAWLSSRSHLT